MCYSDPISVPARIKRFAAASRFSMALQGETASYLTACPLSRTSLPGLVLSSGAQEDQLLRASRCWCCASAAVQAEDPLKGEQRVRSMQADWFLCPVPERKASNPFSWWPLSSWTAVKLPPCSSWNTFLESCVCLRHLHRCDSSIIAQWRSSLLPARTANVHQHTNTHTHVQGEGESMQTHTCTHTRTYTHVFNCILIISPQLFNIIYTSRETWSDILLCARTCTYFRDHAVYIQSRTTLCFRHSKDTFVFLKKGKSR